MAAHSMVEGASKSLAEECERLCAEESRVKGVKGDVKHAKREASAAVKIRHYHVQDPTAVQFANLKMQAKGFSAGEHNGLMAMYNFRFDPDLGLGKGAVRRIPCGCDTCYAQLSLPWRNGKTFLEQDRYARNENCAYWPLFEGLNDWTQISLVPKAGIDEEELNDARGIVLDGIAEMISETIEVGESGAFMTDDTTTDGYYLVEWAGEPYTLQEETVLNEYEPPIILPEGELVCEAKYWSQVPRAKRWFTPSQTGDTRTVVRLQQVVASRVRLIAISATNKMPNTCDKRTATRLGARKLHPEDHEAMVEEMSRREVLDFHESANETEDIEDDISETSDISDSSRDDSV
jgi:hypothetical protein